MVDAQFDEGLRIGTIVLRPNRSWTWRANSYLIGALAAISISYATTFAVRGFWLILPFTALELSALAACLYVCVRRTHLQEVITFSVDELVVERGHRRPEHVHRFSRFFARFRVEPTVHPWYQSRIAIHARDETLEIGRFLPPDEKARLVSQLRIMVARFP
jgi:uncharacterized membrane protein